MARNNFIGSTKNQFRKKSEVVSGMNKKLASGKDVVASFEKQVKAKKASVIIAYVVFYTIFLTIGFVTARYLNFESREEILEKMNKFVEPVKSMEKDFAADKLSPDQYARYLSSMLVHADRVPEKYKQGVPRFTREEIYAKLKSLWPMLLDQTKKEIKNDLPALFSPDTKQKVRSDTTKSVPESAL
ncbi:MAG: hypothetical protein GF350_08780 [Chitinivibrionales bacterium]|nr:hypothetical protein [Chitinivibrionales bacterium]